MNLVKQYWNMLVRDHSDDPDHHKNIFNNQETNIIIGFNKKNRTDFLSNFYPSTVSFENELYPTVEHAYQASKSLNVETRSIIKKAKTPYEAKKLGKSLILREDWDEIKIEIMRILINEKFKNPFLRYMLSLTNGYTLINENKWNDRFWGVTNGIGQNWLGKILEEVRSQIIVEDSSEITNMTEVI